MISRPHEYKKMYDVEDSHWWYVCLRHRIIREIIACYGNNLDINILDAGCGTGGLIKELLSRGYKNVEGFDVSSHAVDYCKLRGLKAKKADVENIDKEYRAQKYDVIVFTDVLYFFCENDWRRITDKMNTLLTSQGIIVMNLPAFKAFSGSHDIAVGINRRFKKGDIRKIFSLDKYKILNIIFWPLFLSPIIYIVRRLQKIMRLVFGYNEVNSDINLPVSFVNKILLWLACLDRIVCFRPNIGSSMLISAKNILNNA